MPNQFIDSGNSAVDVSLTCGQSAEIVLIRLHLATTGGVGCGSVVVWVDSILGSNFDYEFCSEDMAYATDFTITEEEGLYLQKGSVLRIQWDNAHGVEYGIEILYN